MHPSTFLVTGGAGFIGSHLTDALLARGERVVILDDLSTGSEKNLSAVRDHPQLRVVQGSVLDEGLVDELTAECRTVVHLAAAVGVRLVVDRPLHSFTTNVRGTEHVVRAAHRHGRRLLVASSSEVYGRGGTGPLHEESDRVLGPTTVARWSYATAKAVDEFLALAHHRELGLHSVVVRFFNTVGPRQSPAYGMVVPRLVRQAVAGEPLTVHGDGQQRRSFLHVADTVDALLRLLDGPEARGGVFNIGSTEEIGIRDLAARILMRSGSTSPVRLVPHHEVYGAEFEDVQRRVPDTGRLRALTGWRPLHTLDDVLDDALAEARAEAAPTPA